MKDWIYITIEKDNDNFVKPNNELFDEEEKDTNKLNPPKWNLEPPYENVRTVIR